MITLKTKRLRVEISEPGECPNDGFRFDRAGFISEVVLDGAKHFCANEPQNLPHPSTGGRGLCSEIKPEVEAVCRDKEKYLKFGVGLISCRTDAPYCFFEKYENVEEFPVICSFTEMQACFEVQPILCDGYGLREHKKISVSENVLLVEYCFENVGEKVLKLEEYCHNFLSIDGMAISPDYQLELPCMRDFGNEEILSVCGKECNLVGKGHGLTFKRAELAVSLADVDTTDIRQTAPFCWKLRHVGAKSWVEGEESFVPSRVTVWATDHIVSPEFIHAFTLAPGEKRVWSRKMVFDSE